MFKLAIAGLTMAACFAFFAIASMLVLKFFFDVDINSLTADNPDDLPALKFIQAFWSTGLFIVPGLVLSYLFYHQPKDPTGLTCNERPYIITFILVLLATLSLLPTVNALTEFNAQLRLPDALAPLEELMRDSEDKAQHLTRRFLTADSVSVLLLNLFIIAVLPALGEEFVFRGLLQRIFSEWLRNAYLAILLAGILFSAMHLQFYGFLPRLLLGVFFGYLFLWSKSIWLPIFGHLINNTFAVLAYYFVENNYLSPDIETVGAEIDQQWFIVLISLSVFAVLCFLIHRLEKNRLALKEQSFST